MEGNRSEIPLLRVSATMPGPRLRILHRWQSGFAQNGFTIEPDVAKLVLLVAFLSLSLSLRFSVLIRTRHRKSRFNCVT